MPTLHRTPRSGDLLPARFTQVLGGLRVPRAVVRGQELRVAATLDVEDAAAASFRLDFAAQGARVSGEARGPSRVLLVWAFHAIAEATKARLVVDDADVSPEPAAHREAALAYLADYEAEVASSPLGGAAFVDWLAREGQIELAGPAKDVALDDASALYEALLEDDAVADVFLSERELASMLERFRAREAFRAR